jgi:hypothetical protein
MILCFKSWASEIVSRNINYQASLKFLEKQSMKKIIKIIPLVVLLSVSVSAQQPTFQDSLLDHLAGKWVLQGTIAGKKTTHDIVAKWVLGHQYVRLHEVSREKNVNGEAAYEAIVFIGWDRPSSRYACLWLDCTGGGGLSAQAIGHAKRNGDEIPFLFKGSDGSIFHTTFVFAPDADTWQWLMDDEENGKLQPFARVTLTKR